MSSLLVVLINCSGSTALEPVVMAIIIKRPGVSFTAKVESVAGSFGDILLLMLVRLVRPGMRADEC